MNRTISSRLPRLAILSALASVAVGASLSASPAAADNPRATYSQGGNPGIVGTHIRTCQTPQTRGVRGAYGAWGYYIDGCTVRITCASHARSCIARSESSISLLVKRADRVTLNSRLRIDDASGQMIWRRDKSCAGVNTCTTTDETLLGPGQIASVQCNGVREPKRLGNDGVIRCRLAVQTH